MSAKEINSDRKKVDANYNEMTEFQIDHLSLLRKASADFVQDPESLSVCPLLTPSPTGPEYQSQDPLSQAIEQNKMLLSEKSPSPDFNQDEETALLASSPLASYSNPLEPLRTLSGQPTESFAEANGTNNKHVTGNLTAGYQHRSNLNSEGFESSGSSSTTALPENMSSAQLLANHYQQLDDDKLDNVSNFICQENAKNAPIDILSDCKSPPDFAFVSWNWPLIRKSCFWTLVSATIACLCVLVAMLANVPRRCYPAHAWYQGTLFYEIFPPSFQDSNGDGLGDFRGIASRLDYLSKLGVRAVRLNSIFPSEHYPESFEKVTNLTEIDKSLGNQQDFEFLLNSMSSKNISVILDIPVFPYVRNIGEMRVKWRNVGDKITNAVHNHRSHRSAVNVTRFPAELTKTEFATRKRYLKPYIDGGIAGLMKSTSDHLNSISQSIIEEALEFWFGKGVDGIYLKGLEHYANDSRFLPELRKWKAVKDHFRAMDRDVMLMTDYGILNHVTDEETVLTILSTMDLLDVYLDVSNGTSHIKSEVTKYQASRLFDDRNYPWIHWNIGNVETKRLAGRVENNFGAILFEFLLPGTISIFYGDEIGLTEIHDPHLDHSDVRYVHHLAPMKWDPNGTGFTRPDSLPWLPYAKAVRTNNIHEAMLSNMTSLRALAPSIYMNSIWKEGESLSNCAFRFTDDNIIVLERSYPRRNAYVVVYNAGTDEARNDLSAIYYRGELLEDSRGRSGIYMSFNNLKLGSGEAFVVKLDK